jgi:hypothetical protein
MNAAREFLAAVCAWPEGKMFDWPLVYASAAGRAASGGSARSLACRCGATGPVRAIARSRTRPAGSPADNSTGATPRPFLTAPGWRVLVAGVSVLISGALLLQLLAGIVLIFRLSRAARPLRADWTAGAHVRVSESVAMPVTFASTILLPADCESCAKTASGNVP